MYPNYTELFWRPFAEFCLLALYYSKYSTAKSGDEHRVRQVASIEKTQNVLDEMHKDINEKVTRERARYMIANNQKCGVLPVNFQEGDFVLVRRAQRKGHKLSFV